MSEMYWLYNKIKAQDKTDLSIRQGSSLWLNLWEMGDMDQILSDGEDIQTWVL